MADFGPAVFHALARYADEDNLGRNFRTCEEVYKIGLDEYSTLLARDTIIKTTDAIEQLKNALWKMIMLGARDNLIDQINDTGKKGPAEFALRFKFGNKFVHPNDKKTDLEWMPNVNVGFVKKVLSADGNEVFEVMEADNIPRSDTRKVAKKIPFMAAACGRHVAFDEIFGDEEIYQEFFGEDAPFVPEPE